jgi:hypothetical protein
MSNHPKGATETGPSHRLVELGVAGIMVILALIGIAGALKAEIGWGFEGPKAGFFPFYVCLIVLGASIVNIFNTLTEQTRGDLFATWYQLRQVMSVVVPTAVYVAVVPWIGIYVASMVLIAFFMKTLGNYKWRLILPIAIGVPVIIYLVFERWFLVPLPKGPVEYWLYL